MDGKNAPGGKPPPGPNVNWRFTLWYLMFALIALAWSRDMWVGGGQIEAVRAARTGGTAGDVARGAAETADT